MTDLVPVDSRNITAALGEFFPVADVEWRPGATTQKKDRAMAIAYIDARCVMDRLDAVLGCGGWQDSYTVMPGGFVTCTLSLKIGGEWICKSDVGKPSGQEDPGDRIKAAYSDALKRAAIKWGIGRYLYEIPGQWLPYDKDKKCLTQQPQMPARFIPKQAPALPKPATAKALPAPNNQPERTLPPANDPFQQKQENEWMRKSKEHMNRFLGLFQLARNRQQAMDAKECLTEQIRSELTAQDAEELKKAWQATLARTKEADARQPVGAR